MTLTEAMQNLADRKCRYLRRREGHRTIAALRDQHSDAHRVYVGYLLEDIFIKDGELGFSDYLATDWECVL